MGVPWKEKNWANRQAHLQEARQPRKSGNAIYWDYFPNFKKNNPDIL
jgi:hypothetical protein